MRGIAEMSVQVSYKKQAALMTMVLVTLLAMLAGIAQAYYTIPGCQYGASEASAHLSIVDRSQICADFKHLKKDYERGYRQLVPNQHLQTININDQGFRGSEISAQKPDNTYRIFFLGGSTAFGSGSTSDSTTIPGYLQSMYDARDLPFEMEVINAGVGGAPSYVEYRTIKDRLLDMDPDLFIIYDGWNDANRHPDNPGISHEAHSKIMRGELTLEEHVSTARGKQSFRDLYADVGLARLVVDIRDNVLQINQDRQRIFDDTPIEEKISIWVDRWNEICTIGGERGFEVIVIVQPALGSGNYTMSKSEMELYERGSDDILIERLARYASALPSLDSCANTVDLRGVLDGVDRPIFHDGVHLNDYGNEIVASAIFDESYPTVMRRGS